MLIADGHIPCLMLGGNASVGEFSVITCNIAVPIASDEDTIQSNTTTKTKQRPEAIVC